MAWYSEFSEDPKQNEACIRKWFPDLPKEKAHDASFMAALLSNKGAYGGKFSNALERVSRLIWEQFSKIDSGSNRLTRAIQNVGADFGFVGHTAPEKCRHVAYIGLLSEDEFLGNVKNRTLWKDSFGLGHGEFSHSYQWLATGVYFGWGTNTAELYKNTFVKSSDDIFHLSNFSISKGKLSLWEWLVDSVGIKEGEANLRALGYSDEHQNLVGHCFTEDTFRFANNIQTTLEKNDDWFIGYMATRRKKRLMAIGDAYEERHYAELKVGEVGGTSKGQWKKTHRLRPVAYQQLGLKEKYESQRPGTLVGNDRGIYEGDQRIGSEKESDWGVKAKFHGTIGIAPKFEDKLKPVSW